MVWLRSHSRSLHVDPPTWGCISVIGELTPFKMGPALLVDVVPDIHQHDAVNFFPLGFAQCRVWPLVAYYTLQNLAGK